jgi:hypothetical protein
MHPLGREYSKHFSYPCPKGFLSILFIGKSILVVCSQLHSRPRACPLPAAARAGPRIWPASGDGCRKGFDSCSRTSAPADTQGGLAKRWPPAAALCPSHWTRSIQRLEVTSGELLPDQAVPLLKRRKELTRAEALKL